MALLKVKSANRRRVAQNSLTSGIVVRDRMTFHREAGRRIVCPNAAERRAASRISVTVTFVSTDDSASSFAPSTTTARRYDKELSYGVGMGLAAICCSLLDPLLRTRMSLPATVMAYPVWPYTSMSLRLK